MEVAVGEQEVEIESQIKVQGQSDADRHKRNCQNDDSTMGNIICWVLD